MTQYAHKDRFTEDGKAWFGPRPEEPLGEQINALIDKALVDDNARQIPRGYLGGSRLGVECHRALAYEYQRSRANRAAWEAAPDRAAHRTPHPFRGQTVRRFRMGHWHEDETAAWLRMAGFLLATEKPGGGQIGFGVAPDPETGEPRLSGHIDGRIDDGPIKLPYPLLWEHKIANNKNWNGIVNVGVKKAKPVYYSQCQVYMGYLDLKNCMFCAVNTDTSELHVEIIPFVPADAQWASDRGVAVLQASRPEELPRISRDPNFYQCKWCNFREECWAKRDAPQPSAGKPAWLTHASSVGS